jgi:hypothetical protein
VVVLDILTQLAVLVVAVLLVLEQQTQVAEVDQSFLELLVQAVQELLFLDTQVLMS